MNESFFLSTDDLSKMLDLPMSFIYEHTRKGSKDRIPGIFGFGKHIRFKKDEVTEWIKKHRKK